MLLSAGDCRNALEIYGFRVWQGLSIKEPFEDWLEDVFFVYPVGTRGAIAFSRSPDENVADIQIYSPGLLPSVRKARAILFAARLLGYTRFVGQIENTRLARYVELIGFHPIGDNWWLAKVP